MEKIWWAPNYASKEQMRNISAFDTQPANVENVVSF